MMQLVRAPVLPVRSGILLSPAQVEPIGLAQQQIVPTTRVVSQPGPVRALRPVPTDDYETQIRKINTVRVIREGEKETMRDGVIITIIIYILVHICLHLIDLKIEMISFLLYSFYFLTLKRASY
jgi:hypothetical protein